MYITHTKIKQDRFDDYLARENDYYLDKTPMAGGE
jgi:hypothetical protein